MDGRGLLCLQMLQVTCPLLEDATHQYPADHFLDLDPAFLTASNCTSRRMPWQRTAAYRPNLVLSPIIKGKELMAGMPNIDDADVDLEQPPCALESEPDPRPLGIAPIARITSSEQLSGMTAYGTVSCEDSECGVSPSQHSPSEESLPAEESWTCQVTSLTTAADMTFLL